MYRDYFKAFLLHKESIIFLLSNKKKCLWLQDCLSLPPSMSLDKTWLFFVSSSSLVKNQFVHLRLIKDNEMGVLHYSWIRHKITVMTVSVNSSSCPLHVLLNIVEQDTSNWFLSLFLWLPFIFCKSFLSFQHPWKPRRIYWHPTTAQCAVATWFYPNQKDGFSHLLMCLLVSRRLQFSMIQILAYK